MRNPAVWLLFALCLVLTNEHPRSFEPPLEPARGAKLDLRASHLGLRFEPNMGQWDERVRFVARTGRHPLFITNDAMELGGVTMRLEGSHPGTVRGQDRLPTVNNYYLGGDPGRWRTNVPSYARVRAEGWLPGVALVWHEGGGGVEYDVEVAAGVDATTLTFTFEGARSLSIANDGAALIGTADGTLVQQPPRVRQRGRELTARYVQTAPSTMRLALESYDAAESVLVDPVLKYSTYVGGGQHEEGFAIAVDPSGNAYVTAVTDSNNYPLKNAAQTSDAGSYDVAVSKLDPTGASLVFSTYLGGSNYDAPTGMAADSSGNAYVTGFTRSTDFPTKSAFQAASGGATQTGFVAKLGPTGTLLYSTYLGGNVYDTPNAIAADATGNAYVTGATSSKNWPLQSAYQSTYGPVFITKINPSGSALVYSTYLGAIGGSGAASASGIAVDGSGNTYIAGTTFTIFWPLKNPIYTNCGGNTSTVFVTKLNAAGNALVYSTCLGGTGGDLANAVAVDTSGNAYVTGDTGSWDFPTASPFQSQTYALQGTTAFIAKINAAGNALVYSSFLGGSTTDHALGVGADSTGAAYVAGHAMSSNFPTYNAFQTTYNGPAYTTPQFIAQCGDAFITKVGPTGNLVYSTFYGGLGADAALGLAVGPTNDAYVVGYTTSVDLPVANALQATNAGGYDMFVGRIYSPDFPNGTACGPGECASGNCVDGVCCDTPCSGQCQACDVDGSVGTCTPVTGLPHGTVRPACGGVQACESCDGVNVQGCSLVAQGTLCATTCSASVETDSFCDGLGHCGSIAAHSCNNLLCDGDAGTCKASCGSDNDCVSGNACLDGGCVPGARCVDNHTAQPPNAPTKDCTPYACVTVDGCRTQCASVDDCASPNVCDQTGHCVPPSASSGGCNCEVGSRGTPWWVATLAGVLAALGLLRRRRRA